MENEQMAFNAACFMGTGPSGKRFVYVQVPKVACTSIKTALLPSFGLDPPEEGFAVHRAFWGAGVKVSKRKLARPRLRHVYRFSFVRNPFDRLVSAYFSKLHGRKRPRLANPEFAPSMTFGEFAETVCGLQDGEIDLHVRSQWTFLDGVKMDFVGHMEQMEEDYARVAGVLGVPPDLPHSNKSGGRADYRAYYDDELTGRVAERYRGDLEAFGYSF